MRVEVLGPLHVIGEPGELRSRDFRGAKPKQVFQILVVERGHTVSKERLADLLWGESTPRNYLATLETYVSVLRQVLDPGGTPRDSVVLTERGGYRLDLDRVQVDLDDFDRAVDEASRAEPLAALEALRRALSLVRGQVLEDEPYADWARPTREVYTQRQVQVLTDAGRLSLLTGDATAGIDMARQAVALNPLAEPAYQVLMAAAYSLWRQDEALAAFDTCRRLLAEELGVDPMDETVALQLSILRHADLAQMLPGSTAAVASGPTPDRLALLGRDTELQQLRAAAGRAVAGRFTVVLVVGASGVGKSRLMEALAEELDLPVGRNRCSDLESCFPYLALALALRQVLPDLGGLGLPGLDELLQRAEQGQPIDHFARLRVMESLAGKLPGHPGFLILIDDVHWADPETVTTLSYLQRRSPDAKVLVVLTYDPAISAPSPVRALRPDLRIDLRELPQAAVEGIAGPDLHAAAGGNPSHIADWLDARARGLSEPFTPELRERVVTACWDLGPPAFRLLGAAAAVDGPTFSVDLMAHLLDAGLSDVSEQLDLLFEKSLLDAAGDEFTFRSPAIRSILRCTLSPARQRLLRQSAARFEVTGPRRRATDRPVNGLQGLALQRRRASDVEPEQEAEG